jgi:D-alanine-D-alanine ligase
VTGGNFVTSAALDIGVTCNLKRDVAPRPGQPEDALVEYDSDATLHAVLSAIEAAGHRARYLGYGEPLIDALRSARPQLVFNFAEGVGGRSRAAQVPALLEMLGVPYTHSDPLTLAVAQDKAVCKHVVRSHGVRTARFCVIEEVADISLADLRYPLFAKPVGEGSSMGIHEDARVEDARALEALVRRLIERYREPVLVEEFLPGAEFTVGILGTGPSARVLGTSSISPRRVSNERFVYSLSIKQLSDWREHVEIECPPRCDARTRDAVEQCALAAYRALGCRDVGRVDVRLDRDGEPSFIELNPLPGIAPGYSDLAMITEASGQTHPWLIRQIIDGARARLGL